MFRIISKFYFSLGMLLFTVCAANASDGVLDMTQKYFFHLERNELSQAAHLLHCPEELSEAKLESERKSIVRALEVFREELGQVISHQISIDTRFKAVAVGCGEAEYWVRNPPTHQIIYKTTNRSEGDGFVVFKFSLIDGRYVLSFVSHGVPVSEKSDRVIGQLYHKLIEKQ